MTSGLPASRCWAACGSCNGCGERGSPLAHRRPRRAYTAWAMSAHDAIADFSATESSELGTSDGVRLALRRWPRPSSEPRATVLIVHGLGEHVGRYEHVAARLRDSGFGVVGYDHRGH